jgi:hypothetical protein
MNPATIIREAQADGVRLALSPAGTIKVAGGRAALARWLPVIRERKAEIIAALEAGASDDRRLCTECRHLRGEVCSIAKPGGIVDAARGYRPVRRLVRCAGFEELPAAGMTNVNHAAARQNNGGNLTPRARLSHAQNIRDQAASG